MKVLFLYYQIWSLKSISHFHCIIIRDLIKVIPEWSSGFPYFLQFNFEFLVRTRHGSTDWFHIGKGVCQGCILSPCLFNLYTEYIMRIAGLDEAQAGIKISARNINNLRYADDTTFMAGSKELKSLFMKVKEEGENVGFKLTIQKTKIMVLVIWSCHFMAKGGETVVTVADFIF